MANSNTQILFLLIFAVLGIGSVSIFGFGHQSPASGVHHCSHGHTHHHHHHHQGEVERKLPEELAEEEDLKLYGFGSHHGHYHDHEIEGSELSGVGLWLNAMGCSLLVSLASLICLIILPLLFIQGEPSKAVVDALALFGAGAMLGDAFLHQLPHAFGGEHSHSHNHDEHVHSLIHSGEEHSHSHAHSLKDLSVGLSVLAGIVVFLVVEKIVRYVEDNSRDASSWGHGHHHHHHRHSKSKKLKDDNDEDEKIQEQPVNDVNGSISEISSDGGPETCLIGEKKNQSESLLRKRTTGGDALEVKPNSDAPSGSVHSIDSVNKEESFHSPSNLVFGYLNLFSDGVHNFTDGMALGSAFLLYGSVGGWSRTLFLLAHELPQEIGDFGILVRSGFSVFKALSFNFLSALVALAGTALALMWGQDPGQSSLIEGFTAGGFIYIAVAGVLAEMNNGSSAMKTTAVQLISLLAGIGVALCISLVE